MKIPGIKQNFKLIKAVSDVISLRFRIVYLIVTLIGLILIASILSPDFLKLSNIINILVRTSFLLVMGTGMTFVIIGGGIDLSVASVAVLSHVVVAVILRDYGISFVVIAISAGIGSGMVIGLINGIIISKLQINAFIVTMGTLAVARSLAELIAKGVVMGVPPVFSEVLGNGEIWIFPVLTVISLLVAVFAHVLLSHTKIGANIRGIGASYHAAKYLGIPADTYKICLFVLSGFLAGLAGVMLVGRMGAANPGVLAGGAELDVIAAPIIGGATFRGGEGSILGTLIGTIIVGIIGNLLILLGVEAYFQGVVSGLIILAAVFVAHSGQKTT